MQGLIFLPEAFRHFAHGNKPVRFLSGSLNVLPRTEETSSTAKFAYPCANFVDIFLIFCYKLFGMNKKLKIVEVAEHFNRDRSTVLRWVESGAFPNAHKESTPLGDLWLVPDKDVRAFNPPVSGRKPKLKEKAA